MFDAQSFLDSTTTDANSTKREPCPVGEYPALIEKIDARQSPGSKDPTKTYTFLDVTLSIEDQGVKDALGKDKVNVRYSCMLDFTEAGGLDMGKGKNVGLGRLRAAVGLNEPGQPFAPSMMVGRMLKANVSHRIDGEDVYDECKAVAPYA